MCVCDMCSPDAFDPWLPAKLKIELSSRHSGMRTFAPAFEHTDLATQIIYTNVCLRCVSASCYA